MTILFDFDGTIAKTFELTIELFNQVAADYKLPQIKKSDINQIKNSSAQELLKRYPLSPWQLLRLTKHIQGELKNCIRQIEVVEGFPKLIQELKNQNMTLGIVTSNSQENVELFLTHHKLNNINFIYSEKNLFGKGKVLKNVIKRKKFEKQKTIYIGDEVRDIEAARQAGIQIIAVTWGFNSKARLERAKPDFLVSKPLDILPIFT
jgi:phosphoglycolate phosphatase